MGKPMVVALDVAAKRLKISLFQVMARIRTGTLRVVHSEKGTFVDLSSEKNGFPDEAIVDESMSVSQAASTLAIDHEIVLQLLSEGRLARAEPYFPVRVQTCSVIALKNGQSITVARPATRFKRE